MLDVLDGIVLPFLESLYARFGYVGVSDGVLIEGVATFAAGTTAGAVFDADAPKGDLAWAAPDLGSAIHGAEVA